LWPPGDQCVSTLAPEAAKAKLKRPIHFAFSYDEEVGCTGVSGLINDLVKAKRVLGETGNTVSRTSRRPGRRPAYAR